MLTKISSNKVLKKFQHPFEIMSYQLKFNNIKEQLLFDTFHDKSGQCPKDLFLVKKCLSFEALVHNQ